MFLVSRTETYAKLFFLVSLSGLVMYMALAFYTFHTAYSTTAHLKNIQSQVQRHSDLDLTIDRYGDDLKYILFWNYEGTANLDEDKGQIPFIQENCNFINCYITKNSNLLDNDYSNFQAIVFDSYYISKWRKKLFPTNRKPAQKYIFYSMQPCDIDVVCNKQAESFFNWTWTYKLYADIFTPMIEITDMSNKIVGPSYKVEWIEDVNMSPLANEEVTKMKTKQKAVAWLVHKCITVNNRITYVKQLQFVLKSFDLELDIFGGCQFKKCPNETDAGCLELFKMDYYFYLAFEESFAEDYVSQEIVKAADTNTVPIVYGGADYTKFLPDGSYINARYLTPGDLAAKIDYAIRNAAVYFSFFKWKNYYKIREFRQSSGVCQLCALLNSVKYKEQSVYKYFRSWWYSGPLREKCLPKGKSDIFPLNLTALKDKLSQRRFTRRGRYFQ